MSRTQKDWPVPHPLLTGLALAALGALCAAPLLLESTAFVDLAPFAERWQTGLACGVVLLAMLLVVGVRTWLDRKAEPHALALNVLFVARSRVKPVSSALITSACALALSIGTPVLAESCFWYSGL